jgi:hypothetical protein
MFLTLASIAGSAFWLGAVRPRLEDYSSYTGLFDCESRVLKSDPGRSPWLRLYLGYKIKELPSIDVDKFINMYKVNPEDWVLHRGVAYKNRVTSADMFESGIFFTPFSNYRRYEKFRKRVEKDKQKYSKAKEKINTTKTQEEILNRLLDSVKEDIEKTYKKAEEDMKKVTEEAYEIKLRLEKEND